MRRTQHLREQHDRILEVSQQMTQRLASAEPAESKAVALRKLLSTLVGKLTIHLAMEDESMYPLLLKHPDARLSQLGRRYMDEMGGLSKEVRSYADRWPSAVQIQRDLPRFSEETSRVLQALHERVGRENDELYPLIDLLL